MNGLAGRGHGSRLTRRQVVTSGIGRYLRQQLRLDRIQADKVGHGEQRHQAIAGIRKLARTGIEHQLEGPVDDYSWVENGDRFGLSHGHPRYVPSSTIPSIFVLQRLLPIGNWDIEFVLAPVMRNIPPIHLILAFDAVARMHSFNKAADELSISHSSISHRIRELERMLGNTLFNRTTRSVALSAEGEYLHEQMKGSLDTLESAFANFSHKRDVVRISALPSFARFRLVTALTVFHRTHPAVSVEILPTTRKVDINQGDADIAIRFTKSMPIAYHCEHLLDDEWFPVAAPQYLQQLGSRNVLELFKRADFLSHSRQPWDSWLQKAKIQISAAQRNLTYSDTGFILDAALNLQGIALGRRSLVKGLLQSGALVRVSDIAIPSKQSYFLLASERAMISHHGSTVIEWIHSLVQDG